MTRHELGPRYWEDAAVGDLLRPCAFPLPVYRLIVAAGANRDFNSIHHNSDFARATGAPDMYANAMFLQGMWERALREYMGLRGSLRKIAGFRMNSFNCAGDTVVVHGAVERVWQENGTGFAEVRLWSMNAERVSVGPGRAIITLPLREGAA